MAPHSLNTNKQNDQIFVPYKKYPLDKNIGVLYAFFGHFPQSIHRIFLPVKSLSLECRLVKYGFFCTKIRRKSLKNNIYFAVQLVYLQKIQGIIMTLLNIV